MATGDSETQDRADMARLVAGEGAALDALMDRHALAVFHFLCRMLGNEEEANDLAQETFVRVYRACRRYRPEQKFSVWLFTIAANLARNHLRWRARHPRVSLEAAPADGQPSLDGTLPATTPTPRESVEEAERAEHVRAAVQALPTDLREALVLCEWEELTVAEAAAALQTTPKAVESRLYRARRILREQLRRWL